MENVTRNNFEPTRSNRFVVEFPKEFNIESYLVTKISEIHFENSGWKDIEINFIDAIVDEKTIAAPKLFKLSELIGIFDDINVGPIIFKRLNPTGVEVEKWKIEIRRIISVGFGNSDYSSDGIPNLKLTITPSNCTLI